MSNKIKRALCIILSLAVVPTACLTVFAEDPAAEPSNNNSGQVFEPSSSVSQSETETVTTPETTTTTTTATTTTTTTVSTTKRSKKSKTKTTTTTAQTSEYRNTP